jgi:hypothetical protein
MAVIMLMSVALSEVPVSVWIVPNWSTKGVIAKMPDMTEPSKPKVKKTMARKKAAWFYLLSVKNTTRQKGQG